MGHLTTRLSRLSIALSFFCWSHTAAADWVTPSARVTRSVRVRSGTSESARIIARLRPGEKATLLSRRGDWYRVELADGRRGYVHKSWTVVVPTDAEAEVPPPPTVAPGPAVQWFAPPVGPNSNEMNVHVINVGQGAATLYEFPCGAMLVDTGSEKNEQFSGGPHLIAYLDRFFASRPDLQNRLTLLLLTHAHVDHTRNVRTVIERYRPKHLVDNGLTTGSGYRGQVFLQQWARTHGVPYESVAVTDLPESGLGLGGSTIDPINCASTDPMIRVLFGRLEPEARCLPGWTETNCKNGNNSSVVVRIDFGGFSILNMGDLEEAGIDELIARSEDEQMLDVDLYHAGHHGSRNGTTEELVDAMSPAATVISTGDPAREVSWSAWAYGHPNRQALKPLVATGGVSGSRPSVTKPVGVRGGSDPEWSTMSITKAIYATGWDGTIVVHANEQGQFQVLTEH